MLCINRIPAVTVIYCPFINGVFRFRPAFALCAIPGGAALRLRLRHRCGLGLNQNPPFLDGHYLSYAVSEFANTGSMRAAEALFDIGKV
jgi:hypothetical protein